MENKINLVLEITVFEELLQNVEKILDAIPKEASLTDEQRNSLSTMNVDNKVFTEDALVEAQENGEGILSPFINLEHLEKDLTLFNQLDNAETRVFNALQRIKDAKRIAGNEAYQMANLIYNSFSQANKLGIPNAKASYEKLSKRYDKVKGLSPDNENRG